MALIKKNGMGVVLNVFLGAPYLNLREQIDDAKKAIEWAVAHGSDRVVVFPAKNTELFAGKNTNVYTLKSLEAKLSTDKYQADKGADIAAMKAALEKYTVK
jgi:hypothetical protein